MTTLCGAWVLSGATARQTLSRALLDDLRRDCPPGARETFDGPLWLCVSTDARPRALVRVVDGARALVLSRDATGLERVCYAHDGSVLRFADRTRPLLRPHGFALDTRAALEATLAGDMGVLFGSPSLHDGISELRPGETLVASSTVSLKRRDPHPRFPAPAAGEALSPEVWRERLLAAVRAALHGRARAAVALSGGIDSASVAALAVELLGSDCVEAFTYDFDDPSHPPESVHAALVCRRLGMRHHVFKLDFDGYLDFLPGFMRDVEAPRYATGLWTLLASRAAERGHDLLLTGHGAEVSLGAVDPVSRLRPLDRLLQERPACAPLLRVWRADRFGHWPLRALSRLLHPGLERPDDDLYHLVACGLQHAGLVDDAAVFYPAALQDDVRRLNSSERVQNALGENRESPLLARLARIRLESFVLHRDLLGKAAAMRVHGAAPACPYMSIDAPAAGGRVLQRAAMGADLPQEVLARPKVQWHTGISPQWRARVRAALSPLAPEVARELAASAVVERSLLSHYEGELAALGLWLRAERAAVRPASLAELGLSARSQSAIRRA